MTDREPFAEIDEIKVKCEQYWNARGVPDEELHAILAFIWARAHGLNALFNKRLDEEIAKERERCVSWVKVMSARCDMSGSIIDGINTGK